MIHYQVYCALLDFKFYTNIIFFIKNYFNIVIFVYCTKIRRENVT